MANATSDLIMRPYGAQGRAIECPVAATTAIYKGTMVSQLTADGGLVPTTTASSGAAVGVARHGVSNAAGALDAKRCVFETDAVYIFANDTTNPVTEANLIGCALYATDDHTVSDTNTGTDPQAGYFAGREPDGRIRVFFQLPATFGITSFASAQHDHEDAAGGGQITPADALDAAVPATLGGTGQTTTTAGDVLYGAAGNTIAKLAVGTASQVLKTNAGATAPEWGNMLDPDLKGTIQVPITSFVNVAATQLTTFANATTDQPGLELTNSKALAIRWNDHAAPLAVMSNFVMPADADITADATLKVIASKVGNTIGDAVTFTIEAYNQVDAALHDADADFGGTTTAMTGDAATKTVQQESLTLALADLGAVGSNVTLTIKPTGGLLGTDDVCLHSVSIEYTKKLDA